MAGPTIALFGNIQVARGFDFTFGPGVQPSVCMIYTVPHVPQLPSVADLVLQTEGEAPFVFRQCLLEDPRLDSGSGGSFWTLPVKDRRWKWQFASLTGSYNIPRPDGTILRERTPSSLIGLCLQAMGEVDWDASRIPDNPRPERQWDGAIAAAELDRLCAELGCIVVLNPLTDRVEIWPEGEGNLLPNGPIQGSAYAPFRPATPQKVRVESGLTLFQAVFKAEAVGLDTDGTYKPIDELSYKPAGGWATASVASEFPEVTGTYADQNGKTLYKRDLARAHVWKDYRITGLAQGGWAVPVLQGTPFEPQSLRDFRLFPTLVDEDIGPDDGLRQLDAAVYVESFQAFEAIISGAESHRYTDGFSFDTRHGIISFNEPQFQIGLDAIYEAAEVRIECSFNCGAEGIFSRVYLERDTGANWPTPTRLVQRPEIIPRVVFRYSTDRVFNREDNLDDVNTRMTHWMDVALGEYDLQNGGTVNYTRIVPISPDGLTQQVTWSAGFNQEARTTASQAQRHNRFIESLDEYRDRLTAKRIGKALLEERPALALAGLTPFETQPL